MKKGWLREVKCPGQTTIGETVVNIYIYTEVLVPVQRHLGSSYDYGGAVSI